MNEETKTELKLPSKYKRPSYEEFKAAGYEGCTQEEYVEFFKAHEASLAARLASGELTEEGFSDMADSDGDGLPDLLHIRSQVRGRTNRTLRARQPTRHRFKQYLFADPSKRLVRGRVLCVSAAEVRKNLEELLEKEAAGILSVHAPNGQRVDLEALAEGRVQLSVLPPPAPLVNKPLDSAANDLPSGNALPQYQDGTFAGDPIAADVGARLSVEKKSEAEKKGADPLDPVDPPGLSTELEQPPVGVDGEATPIVDQLPKDSEASVEAPAADPLLEEAAQNLVAEEQDRSSLEEPAGEESKDEAPKGGSKKGKKGGSK